MIHRNLRYLSGWEWHVLQLKHINVASQRRNKNISRSITTSLQQSDERYVHEKQELISQYPEAAIWINDSYERFTNHLVIQKVDGFGPVVQGTLMIQLSEQDNDISPLHFWIAESKLILIHRDIRIPLRLQQLPKLDEYEQCSTAAEAFFLMISSLLDQLLIGLDQFENRLGQVELDMRERNRKDLLDTIIERRYELLHFSHLFLPIRELEGLAKEAFLDRLIATEGFQRAQHQFQRIDHLLNHYALEIDTLISVDDAISNFRGNEIIRTLTIFTALCIPATIIGALWGTNFINLPFRNEPYGFLYMIGIIIILTTVIYGLLWKKGWMGDILRRSQSKRKNKLNEAYQQQLALPATDENVELPMRSQRKRIKLAHIVDIQEQQDNQEYIDQPLPSRKHRT